jgi:hypothetical protein
MERKRLKKDITLCNHKTQSITDIKNFNDCIVLMKLKSILNHTDIDGRKSFSTKSQRQILKFVNGQRFKTVTEERNVSDTEKKMRHMRQTEFTLFTVCPSFDFNFVSDK